MKGETALEKPHENLRQNKGVELTLKEETEHTFVPCYCAGDKFDLNALGASF